MTKRFAQIIIDISHEKVDRTFDYRIPPQLEDRIFVGVLVKIPFGKGNSLRKGYVVGITDHADYDADKIKEIAEIVEGGVSAGVAADYAGVVAEGTVRFHNEPGIKDGAPGEAEGKTEGEEGPAPSDPGRTAGGSDSGGGEKRAIRRECGSSRH